MLYITLDTVVSTEAGTNNAPWNLNLTEGDIILSTNNDHRRALKFKLFKAMV